MRTPVALYALALVVRAVCLVVYPDPAYPDSYYYVDVARALHGGAGFNLDFVWSFVDVGGRLPVDPHLPIASNAHWMPLASLIQLPTMWLFGPSGLAGAIPFAVAGATLAPLTWLIARDAGARPSVALAAGIVGAVPAATTVYMSQPDNFSLYAPLGAAALWLAGRGLKGDRRAFALAGLAVGLATLARNDGVLLGAAAALAFFWDRWRSWRAGRSASDPAQARSPIPWRYAFACFGLFLVAAAPWYLRQLAVFGSLSPSAAGGRILFIRTYEEMNSVDTVPTLGWLLGQGIGPLLSSRVLGLVSAIAIFAVLVTSVALAPFAVLGGWMRRRSPDFGPFFVYAALLFGAAGLLFAVHVPYGTFLHSAVALGPHSFVLGLEGIVVAVGWVARRRRTWDEAEATRVFLAGGVGLAVATAVVFGAIAINSWGTDRDTRQAANAALDAARIPKTDLLLSADPGGFKYYTGRGGVVTPNDSLDAVRRVGQAYGARWLVLERGHIVGPLGPVLLGEVRPGWIGEPIFLYSRPTGSPGSPIDLAIYPVCFSTADARCGVAP